VNEKAIDPTYGAGPGTVTCGAAVATAHGDRNQPMPRV
jgi:hypothetical protein